MNKQLQMAVNHAINDAGLARARMGLLNPSMGLDAKRNSAWCEYGFKEELTFGDLYNLYRRGGIAHGAINKIISACWHTSPEIIEGKRRTKLATLPRGKEVFFLCLLIASGDRLLTLTCAVWLGAILPSCFISAMVKHGISRQRKGEGLKNNSRMGWLSES